MIEREIIETYKKLDDVDLERLANEITALTPTNQNHLLNEIKERGNNVLLQQVQDKLNTITPNVPVLPKFESEPHSQMNLIRWLLILLCTGPIFDYFFHLSMFASDPAPKQARVISNTIFFLIYASSAFLFIKQKYWARWISFSLYSLWFIIALLIISQSKEVSIVNYLEVLIRISILIVLLKATSWIKMYETKK